MEVNICIFVAFSQVLMCSKITFVLLNWLLLGLSSKKWWHNSCSVSCYPLVIDAQQHLFFLPCLVLLSTLSLWLGLVNLKCFQTAPLMAAPHVTENKLPCFLGTNFHESLSSKFTFGAMFSSAAQSNNSPLESCLSRTTEVCLAYTHLDFCSLHSLFLLLLLL